MTAIKTTFFCLLMSIVLLTCCFGSAAAAPETIQFINPIGPDNATDLLNSILNALRSVIAVIAIIFIVIGGLVYMTSSGDEKRIDKAKAIITGAVIGLAITIAAPAFLKQILEIFGGQTSDPNVSQAPTLQEIAMRILQFLLSVTGIIAIISLIVGGVYYMTAYGDEDRIDKGKMIVTYSIVGIVVALLSLVIVRELTVLLGQG